MTALLSFRPVISCGAALLPVPGGGSLAPYPLHRGLDVHPLAFHPEEPWRAICQIHAGRTDAGADLPVFAITITAPRLRLLAQRLLDVADHLDIKPAKDPRK